jgi:hypothetical protein
MRNWTNLDLDDKTIENGCAFMQSMFSPISLIDKNGYKRLVYSEENSNSETLPALLFFKNINVCVSG